MAAQNLGFSVLAGIDDYRHACDTYEANFIAEKEDPPKLYREDIQRLRPEKLMSDLGVEPGELDLMMGGPPCQGYSTHRINGAGVDDPRNDLLIQYFGFVHTVRPKACLVENVPGLLWPRHADYLERFLRLADEANYAVLGPHALNAKNFGTPQNRKRVFIIGFRRDLSIEFSWPEPTHFQTTASERKNDREAWVPASVVFEKPLPKGDVNAIHMRHSGALVKVFASTPKNGGSQRAIYFWPDY